MRKILSKFTKKYLNLYRHKVRYGFSFLKTYVRNAHQWCKENGVYPRLVNDVLTILLNGFVLWIMLFAFLDKNPVWLIPSYGIIPWFFVNLVRELKE